MNANTRQTYLLYGMVILCIVLFAIHPTRQTNRETLVELNGEIDTTIQSTLHEQSKVQLKIKDIDTLLFASQKSFAKWINSQIQKNKLTLSSDKIDARQYKASILGQYSDVMNLLKTLSSGRKHIVIQRFTLNPSKRKVKLSLSLEFDIKTGGN